MDTMRDEEIEEGPPETSEPYKVRTEIFEGPMDLLVYLIKKNEVSIYDIPIARITKQFLEYIEWLKILNINLAGDFLYMAAILTNIKSRTLLPAHSTAGDEDEDPRAEIAKALEEYMRIKSVAEGLNTRDILNEDTFVRTTDKKAFRQDADADMIEVGLFELIDAFQKVLDKLPASSRMILARDEISIKDKIAEIVERLEEKRSLTFAELLDNTTLKSEMIAIFLALLEMVKLQLVSVRQHRESGVIRLFYL
jgi:segregation and condensation protein A